MNYDIIRVHFAEIFTNQSQYFILTKLESSTRTILSKPLSCIHRTNRRVGKDGQPFCRADSANVSRGVESMLIGLSGDPPIRIIR